MIANNNRFLTFNNRFTDSLDLDAEDYFNRSGINRESNLDVDGEYSAETLRYAVNWCVKAMKTYGLWGKMKIISPFKGGVTLINKTNLKSNDFEQTFNSITNRPKGVKLGGGTGSYIDLNIDLSSEIVDPNDFHVCIQYNQKNTNLIGADFGVDTQSSSSTTGNNRYLILGDYSGQSGFGIGNDAALIFSTPINDICIMSRISSTDFKVIKDNLKLSNNNFQNATSFPSYSPTLGILRYSDGAFNPSNAEIGFFTLGYGLTEPEMNSLKYIINYFNNMLVPTYSLRNIYFGDSITEGYIDSYNIDLANRWTTKLSNDQNVIQDNRGVGGTTMQNTSPTNVYAGPNMRDRASTDIPNYDSNIHNLMFISYGVNDCYMSVNYTPAIFKTQLGEVIDIAVGKGWPLSSIKVLTPYYIEFYNVGSKSKVEDIRDAVLDMCLTKGCQSINVYDNMTISDLSIDLVHPNVAGHNTIFNYIKSQL